MDNKVTLYIAEHNQTGLKYFGKTTQFHKEIELQEKYHGGGTYWRRHLKKHGDDVTMKIYKICSLNEEDEDYVEPIALKFSEENDIVNSKEWANLKKENGLDGGSDYMSEETKKKISFYSSNRSQETLNKISESSKNRKHSSDSKLKMSRIRKGVPKTAEHKKNISESLTGRKLSYEHIENIAITKRGIPLTQDHIEKIKLATKGIPKSEETKKKMSEAAKNRLPVKCPHCEKEGDIRNMKRWHFDNCKKGFTNV